MKTLVSKFAATLALALSLAGSASAALVTFVPPNDPVGQVFTTNANDLWSNGRGITFTVNAPTTLTSVGVFQNLTNISLSWQINNFNSQGTVYASGGSLVTTSGLQWIDYNTSVNLVTGITYHLEFKFSGNSNQNFFYNNNNVQWSQDGFTALDGTQNGSATNFVVAAFRVNTGTAPGVPDSGSTAVLLLGSVLGLASLARRLAG